MTVLFAELRARTSPYSKDMEKRIREIEEKRKYLETRINFAKGLKESPSLRSYCDLNQLVADLEVNLKNEQFDPDMTFPQVRYASFLCSCLS
ncbi:hypothetical protein GDO86_004648 [Hymenochirus boettgeri]|uniref:Uncharacterized protein n=1 Tax=Hymenochirus boettgeri TaxID=247094 RepID=A0A8T2KEX8_9PIPI|nr:hypothetical protein GDO86_004648 [Hymenochirus boettgeri]